MFHYREVFPGDELLRRTALYALVAPGDLGQGAMGKLVSFLVEQGMLDDERELFALGASLLEEAINKNELAAVALKSGSAYAEGIASLLTGAGFQRTWEGEYEIWSRK